MRYKSEAGTTLYRINRDVGVANIIFMNNAPEKTGYKKNTQGGKTGKNGSPNH